MSDNDGDITEAMRDGTGGQTDEIPPNQMPLPNPRRPPIDQKPIGASNNLVSPIQRSSPLDTDGPSDKKRAVEYVDSPRLIHLERILATVTKNLAGFEVQIRNFVNSEINRAIVTMKQTDEPVPEPIDDTPPDAVMTNPPAASTSSSTMTSSSSSTNKNFQGKKPILTSNENYQTLNVNSQNKSKNINNDSGNNRFAPLAVDDDAGTSSQDFPALSSLKKPKTVPKTLPNKVKATILNVKNKVVPIVAYNVNQKTLRCSLNNLNKSDFKVLRGSNPDRCVILPESGETRDATLSLLKEKDVNHFTFTPREERNSSLIIKNLPHDFELEDITDEFTKLGLAQKIAKISLIQSSNLARFKFYSLQILPGVPTGEFTNIVWFLNSKIKIEKFSNNEEPQCFKCQMLGHFSYKCEMKTRCVKCAGEHLSRECPLAKDAPLEDLTCALCKESGHPASYKGCPKRKQLLKAKKDKYEKTHKPPVREFKSSFVQKGVSFTAALNPNNVSKSPNLTKSNIDSILNSACNELFGCEYSLLKKQFDLFLQSYEEETDINARKKAVLDFILTTNYNG